VILQNRPGAGGVTANGYMMHAAPKDGTVFAEINPGTMSLPLLRSAKYDPRKFEWIGSVAVRGYCGAVWHAVAADTIDKMKKTTVVMGATGQGSQNFQIPTLMNHLLGTKFKVVSGYKGGGEINLAIETGEVQGRANFYEGFVGAKPDWIRDRKLKFFFTLGPDIPALKGVPNLKSLMKTDEEKRMLALIETTLQLGQAFFLPPGTPRARVDALAQAFAKTMKDEQFLADAKKRRLVIAPRTRAENQAAVAEAFDVPPGVAKKVAAVLGFDKLKKK
jgi:tripartite-type tricarboxylate transporter receptor subunit TctC